MTRKDQFICDGCADINICAYYPLALQTYIDGQQQVEITCNFYKKEDKNMLNVLTRRTFVMSDVKELQVGDMITIVNKNEEVKNAVTATVVKVTENQVILFADQSVAERCVTKENVTKFEDTELYNWLNVDFYNTIRQELLEYVHEIRVPYIKEIFGQDELDDWDKKNIDFTDDNHSKWEQIDRRARLIIPYDQYWGYWCMNSIKDRSAAAFALVDRYGVAYYDNASDSDGVRPVLVLDKESKKKEFDGELVNRSMNEIVFGELDLALKFRDALADHVRKHGKLSLMELNDIVNATDNFLNSHYGWNKVSAFGIKKVETCAASGEGYQITFTDPVRIEQ